MTLKVAVVLCLTIKGRKSLETLWRRVSYEIYELSLLHDNSKLVPRRTKNKKVKQNINNNIILNTPAVYEMGNRNILLIIWGKETHTQANRLPPSPPHPFPKFLFFFQEQPSVTVKMTRRCRYQKFPHIPLVMAPPSSL
jgi:hypothetical protein